MPKTAVLHIVAPSVQTSTLKNHLSDLQKFRALFKEYWGLSHTQNRRSAFCGRLVGVAPASVPMFRAPPSLSGNSNQRPPAPANTFLAAHAGAFTASGGQDVGVAGLSRIT